MPTTNLVGTLVYPDGSAFEGRLTLRLNGPAKDDSGNLVMPAWKNFTIGTAGVVDVSIDDTETMTSLDSTEVYYQAILDSEWALGRLKFGTGTVALADAWINSRPAPHASLICYAPFNNMVNKYPRRAGNDIGTFSSAMAYRTGKLGQGILVSGKQSGTGGDELKFVRSTQVTGNNYAAANGNQGSICGWWTPRFAPEVQRLGTENYVLSLVSLGSGVVLAGTYPTGQVYRSTDSGATWSLIQRLGTETEVRSLVSLGSGVVLAGTAATGQVYRSTDSGATWSLIQRLGTENYVLSLVSLGSGVVLAGTVATGQVYRSTDSGATFSANIECILCDFGAGRVLYQGGQFHMAYPVATARASYAHNLAMGTSVFVAATWDVGAAITAKIAANGSAMGTSTAALTAAAPGTTIYIGNDSGNDGMANGVLDDIAIFDRVLGTTEISAAYNSGSGAEAGGLAGPALKAYLKLDGSGNLTSGTNAGLGCSWPWGTAVNLALNGHFESGTNNWESANGTFGLITSGTNNLYDGTTMQINSSAGVEGNITQTVAVGSAANYLISLWGHTLSPNAFGFLGRNAVGSSGTAFGQYEMAIQATATITGTLQINATSAGTAYVDNVWLGTSFLNNGGVEGAWTGGTIPEGWTKAGTPTGTANTTDKHGGGTSLKVLAGDSTTNYYQNAVTVTNAKWHAFVGYLLAGAGTGYIDLSGAATTTLSGTQTTWTRKAHTFKATGATLNVRLYATSGGTCSYDDFAVIQLDDVDVTATPATLGSSYDTGKWGTALGALRIDGGDTFTLPGTTANGRNVWWGTGAISLWVYPEGWHGSDGVNHTIFDIGQSGSTNRLRLQKDSSNNLIFRAWSNTANSYKEISYAVGTASFGSNAWHHILAGWTAIDTDHLWLDGTAVGTEAASGAWTNMGTLGANLYLGSDRDGATELDGLIDEVRIYDAIPTNAQKTTIYNDGQYLGY